VTDAIRAAAGRAECAGSAAAGVMSVGKGP